MATYRVVMEIEVDEENPLAAAQTVEGWLHDTTKNWQYYVQEDKPKGKIFSVDLGVDDEDAVYPADDYTPMIK